MKNFTLFLVAGLLFVTSLSAQTQKGSGQQVPQKGINQPKFRCGTDEMIQQRIQTDPAFRAKWEENLRQFEASKNSPSSFTQRTSTLTGPVTIPTVVHIVLPDPTVVTDADVLYFINRLNLDFSGFNPDSTNGSLFYSVRGHSLIRFTLAKRDPSGNATFGIERRISSTQIQGGNPQPIKTNSGGGLDGWDITQYYNLWVGIGSGGLLGIAPEIGVGGPVGSNNVDGVCVDYRAFSHNPCYTLTAFALARTAVHEIGHNFGLYHTFQGGCGNQDFIQLTSTSNTTSCPTALPASLLAPSDDTPALSANTSGCPSGSQASGCSGVPNPPGKMYQNYMDYTDDPCYSMFTIGQVNRMHYVLENCRPGYLTSQGAVPPASAPTRDAGVTAVINPGGSDIVGVCKYTNPTCTAPFTCTSYPTPICPGNLAPKVRVSNKGYATLTSYTVNWTLNGTPQTPVVVSSASLAPLEDTTITLSSVALASNNTLKFWTSNPNGSTDQNNVNDTTTKVLNFTAGALPLAQGFEGSTFPPAGWSINNPNNNVTWTRVAPGNNSTASIFFDNYTNNVQGQLDDIITPSFSTTGLDSVIIEWDLAHKNYPGLSDRFDVLISTNCGSTFTQVFTRSDPALATAGSSTGAYTVPGAADWVRQRISIGGANLGTGQILVAFRNINGYGNNTFVDNINITGFTFTPRDLSPTAVLAPLTQVCTPTVTPSLTVKNTGTAAITSYKVGYILDGGAPVIPANTYGPIAAGASQNIVFTSTVAAAPGSHTIKFFTTAPDNLVDLFTANDTISKTFNVNQLVSNYSENFEGTFPSANAQVINPNANATWTKHAPGRNSGFAASMDNYSSNVTGQTDDIKLLPINTAGVDSIILTFDVAHKNYPGLDDILSVVASTDCGNNFLATSYTKPGSVLATAGSSTAAYSTPGPGDWRTERVALGGTFVTGGSLILAIRNTNGYGNWIHIDNINITKKYKRDLALVSINDPKSVICSGSVTPSVTIQNVGSEAVTGYSVAYTVDGTGLTSTVGTGTPLAPNATTTVNLTGVTFTQGPHLFKVYSVSPVTASGTGDLNTANDTLTKTVSLVSSIAPPVVEGFENATFPPTGWAVVNADNSTTWTRTTAASKSGSASAYINNYNYSRLGAIDELYTSRLTYAGADSVFVSFDYSALTKNYPGSTTIPMDTLEVMITKDCGATFTTIFKKWGNELQTISDPNYPQDANFVPTNGDHWKNVSVDLTSIAAGNGPLQVVFRNTNNFQNNIYLDNVNVKTVTLPAKLKGAGYLVLPNPFKDQFTVWHYLQPTDLKYISVYNSAGQLVWKKEYNGNADKQVVIDLKNRSAGVYIVHLGYADISSNKTISIIKY